MLNIELSVVTNDTGEVGGRISRGFRDAVLVVSSLIDTAATYYCV